MRVAVFADIHGKFLLPFKLVHHYQQETGRTVDAILQCGDLGTFPDLGALDRATSRHARTDRDELGFHDDFLVAKPEIASFLADLDLDMICVRGNHEDHEFLDRLEQLSDEPRFPIDAYGRVFVCRSGIRQELSVGQEVLSFVGVGRIGDRKGRDRPTFIQPHERAALRRFRKLRGEIDVLISHDQENDGSSEYGMVELQELLSQVAFSFHFYGHTGAPFSRTMASNGVTESVKVKELEFTETGALPPGCMMILEKSGGKLELEVVDQRLTNRFTKHTWRL